MTTRARLMALATLMVGTAFGCYAAPVSLNEAKTIASEFISSRKGGMSGNLQPVYTAGTPSQPLFYVFNVDNNGGFVMVSAESSATPVLGYSFEGSYSAEVLPEPMKWMLSGIEREIKAAPSLQSSRTNSELTDLARRAARQAAQEKLLSTPNWSQEAPFNNFIPGKPLVGCVGTAMATVMKYYNHPATGAGSFGDVDFNVSYDWDNMRSDNYRNGYTAEEGDAVATLMYHASKSIDTQYAMSGSSAYEVRVPGALSSNFGYDPGVSYKKRSEVATQADWDAIVKNEIDEGRPVIYCGQDVTAGHAFVCDGYQGEYLHFNWGWGGSANGYFLSTALNPTVSRTHHYNNLNTIIYNIKPASGTIAAWSPIHITADGNQVGIGSDLTDLASGNPFTVRVGNLKNLSFNDFSGQIAVALYDAAGNFKTLLSSAANFNMQSMGYLYNGYTTFSNCKLPEGVEVAADDVVRIATKATGEIDWLPVAGELPTLNELAVVIANPASFNIMLPSVEGVNVEGENFVIRGWNYSFKVTPTNPDEDVVTVKANGIMLAPNADNVYTISNVLSDQRISVNVQKASEVVAKRSIWVDTPGTLSTLISENETGSIKELTLFGAIDARDFEFMKTSMDLRFVDLSGVSIYAHGSDQANALPRNAFRGEGSLKEIILPNNLNRINNAALALTGISSIVIPGGVSKYEYNVFVSCTSLRDIYVKRTQAEFINWCVLSGCKVDLMTLHVPNEAALTNYNKAENWNTIKNIIVDLAPENDDVTFAVMENADVKFNTEATLGKVEKGTQVTFTAEHIADNDNRMDVYANNTLLKPDAEGVYSTTLNANTIIRFAMEAPISTENNGKSQWTLNDKNGSIGLFTDAVNVLPGQEFVVRANALKVPQYMDQLFWAAALTDSKGNIKEFISPVVLWNGGAADNHKFNVTCCVNEANIREGNQIRLVTSANNKKTWQVVCGENENIVDALPAVNNMTEVYNIRVNLEGNATITGVPETAVRGRDITMKVTPTSPAYRVNMKVNGEDVVTNAATANYTFVAMQDMDIDVEVFDPKAGGVATFTVAPGTFHNQLTADNVAETVVVKGEAYSLDLQAATGKDFALSTIKTLDLSQVKIVGTGGYAENVMNHPLFVYTNGMTTPASIVENIILPDGVTRIAGGIFKNCGNIKEITLPMSLSSTPEEGFYPSGSKKYTYSIADEAFKGCNALQTIYIPGVPSVAPDGTTVVAHHNPYASMPNYPYYAYNLGHPDPKKVTIVVPSEYLSLYQTPRAHVYYGNPWKAHGYNILSEYPVYGVSYDPARITTVSEDVDVNNMASFLMDNVALESIKAEGKLKLINPNPNAIVTDNGTPIEVNEDGTIDITFYNPAKNAALAGNHNIQVLNTYNAAFNKTSDLFILTDVVANNEIGIEAEFDNENNILSNVVENSTVTFKVEFADENEGLEARVMMGLDELFPEADGTYTVQVTNADRNIEIYAVPSNGVTLTAEEISSLNPEESAAITEIGLAGEMSSEEIQEALGLFPNLETLDLSGLESDLPEGAFSGMETLTTVTLPTTTEIPANTFSGCTNLQSVDIPASVVAIGENAFQDCVSLETINLTGIETIGNDAFTGCENLTTIIILRDVEAEAAQNPETPAESRRRAPRRITVATRAFNGVNPNCFVILDEGVEIPTENVNFLFTTTGTLTETVDGEVVEREGRIYTAKRNITITPNAPLAIPYTFTLNEDAEISMTTENNNWESLLVPFTPQDVKDESGDAVEFTQVAPQARTAAGNLLYTLNEDGEEFESSQSVVANHPYMLFTPEAKNIIFSAKGIKVENTPAAIRVNGKDFALNATYSAAELPGNETYLLNSDASGFFPQNDEETVIVPAFGIYATSPVAVDYIETKLPGTDISTGAEELFIPESGLRLAKEGNLLIVYAAEDVAEAIYSVNGQAVAVVNLFKGRNVIELPASGLYIMAGKKFRF